MIEQLAHHIDKVRNSGAGMPVLILLLVFMFVLPLPPFALDFLFTLNIILAIMILINVVQVQKPLDFAAFPTLIMGAAVMRLALNVASTRVILLNGHEGGDAAGVVIESIAQVVIAGDYAVGFVIFAIIMVINLMVVNKGAGRVSEVSARFTLDGMPGKQMAIDADLNQGLIDAHEAKARRSEVVREADFYGRMDGSAKFVKGDSVAGILILLINIVGGLVIGTVTHDLPILQAMETYSLLTIGDGLVAQIPSLIFAIATAVIITRMSESKTLADQITDQLLRDPKNFVIPGFVLTLLGLIPGMPHLPFLVLGITCLAVSWQLSKDSPEPEEESETQVQLEQAQTNKELGWEDIDLAEDITIRLGTQLVPLATGSNDSALLTKLRDIRSQLSKEFGFLIPQIHLRDDLKIGQNNYNIYIQGSYQGGHTLMLDRYLAVNGGDADMPLEGIKTTEPTMNATAYWIDREEKVEAEISGYICVDPTAVIITHVQQVIKRNIAKFVNHESANALVEKVKAKSPKLIEETIPDRVTLSNMVQTLQSLLVEGVPISNLTAIIERISLIEPGVQLSPERLLAAARVASVPNFIDKVTDNASDLNIIMLDNDSQNYLLDLIAKCGKEGIDPSLPHEKLVGLSKTLRESIDGLKNRTAPLLVVPSMTRNFMAQLIREAFPDVAVLSTEELPSSKNYNVTAQASLQG